MMMSTIFYSIYKLPLMVFSIICALTFSPSLTAVQIYAENPYDSGYDHGCDDAGISSASDRYINQDGKGPSFHTADFMNGYNSGVSTCSSSGNDYNENNYSPRSSSGSETDCNGIKILGGVVGGVIGSAAGPVGTLGGAAAGSDLASNLC